VQAPGYAKRAARQADSHRDAEKQVNRESFKRGDNPDDHRAEALEHRKRNGGTQAKARGNHGQSQGGLGFSGSTDLGLGFSGKSSQRTSDTQDSSASQAVESGLGAAIGLGAGLAAFDAVGGLEF